METRRIGDCWSSVRGLLEYHSTKTIKEFLGKAGLPVYKIEDSGTWKGPLLDAADSMMRTFDDDTKDRIARGCIEELISCERRKSEIAAKQDKKTDTIYFQEIERVLARVGYGISGNDVFPLSLQLDLEMAALPADVSEAIAEALRRYRDGKYAGAITCACGAVDQTTERLFLENSLGDHKEASYQERVSKAFATKEDQYCAPLRAKGLPPNEVKQIWENHKKAISQSAYVLGAFRREYSDVHGGQSAPVEFVQKSLDCAVFILRSFLNTRVGDS